MQTNMKEVITAAVSLAALANGQYWNPDVSPTGPLDKDIDNYDENCLAIKGPPLDTSASQGQMPQFCQFASDVTNKRCCTTSHDIHIKNHVQGLWPDECSKNEYPGLTKLMCMACSSEQPKYTYESEDGSVKVIRICESLLKEFYGNGDATNSPTDAFEKCGAWNSPDTTLDPIDVNDPGKGFSLNSPDASLIFPKSAFTDMEDFYKNFNQAGIPFMGDYAI